ncbi:uncharacterized protein MELLADRAFT_106943 [Melampsora larici-populina 98AG31]|uniref:Uncharacterized protein n=1 Tax=Melampsora larici-populina (strain 98AG31 / pathotype 3-4-7) TaxID=747676 RepID=F4RN56_MELLP|nr:uncharacterized protein MELLADRAFT_106943 [Melampsora larici-populina 98AG31]EGG06240.1 hypothetical protein MELLADRAFT_106943 [Melampsora larici-populina 98AG31]
MIRAMHHLAQHIAKPMRQYPRMANSISHDMNPRVQGSEFCKTQYFDPPVPIPDGWMVYDSTTMIPLFSIIEDALLYHQSHTLQPLVPSNVMESRVSYQDTHSEKTHTGPTNLRNLKGYSEFHPNSLNNRNPVDTQSKLVNNSANTHDGSSGVDKTPYKSHLLRLSSVQKRFGSPHSQEAEKIGHIGEDKTKKVETSEQQSDGNFESQNTFLRITNSNVGEDVSKGLKSLEKSSMPDSKGTPAGNYNLEDLTIKRYDKPSTEKKSLILEDYQEGYQQELIPRNNFDVRTTGITPNRPVISDFNPHGPHSNLENNLSHEAYDFCEDAASKIDTSFYDAISNKEIKDLNDEKNTCVLDDNKTEMSAENKEHLLGALSHDIIGFQKASKSNNLAENSKREIPGDGDIERNNISRTAISLESKAATKEWSIVQSRNSKTRNCFVSKDHKHLEEPTLPQQFAPSSGDIPVKSDDKGIQKILENHSGGNTSSSINTLPTPLEMKFVENEAPVNAQTKETLYRKDLDVEKETQAFQHKKKKHKNTKALIKSKLSTDGREEDIHTCDEHLKSLPSIDMSSGTTNIQDIKSLVSKILCADDKADFLKIKIGPEDCNQISLLLGSGNQGHLLNEIYEHTRMMKRLMNPYEAWRRSQTLHRYVDQENTILKWNLKKGQLDHKTHAVAMLLRVGQRSPVFYDTAPGKWKLIKSRWDSLNEVQADSLNSLIDIKEQEARLATISVMENADQHWMKSLYGESELQQLKMQGVSIPLLFKAIYVMDLDKYYDTHQKNWIATPLRHFILEDQRLSLHFQARLKFLVNNTHDEDLDGTLTLAEGLTALHFGILLDRLTGIKFLSSLAKEDVQISNQDITIGQESKTFYWSTPLMGNWDEWKVELQPYLQFLGFCKTSGFPHAGGIVFRLKIEGTSGR